MFESNQRLDHCCLLPLVYTCNINGELMASNVAFNNISVILCWSVLLVEETNDLSQITDILYHILLYRVHISITGIRTHSVSGNMR